MLTRLLAFSRRGGRGFRKLTESSSMWKGVVPVACLLLFAVQAEAHPHHRYRHQQFRSMALFAGDIQTNERIVSGRPSGCPHAFCGCEASLFRFGRVIPQLNLASNWRRFPRTAPATGMAAVRGGHVMILQQHIAVDTWYSHAGTLSAPRPPHNPPSILRA